MSPAKVSKGLEGGFVGERINTFDVSNEANGMSYAGTDRLPDGFLSRDFWSATDGQERRCDSGACVDVGVVAGSEGKVAFTNRNANGPVLVAGRAAWNGFLAAVKNSEYDGRW